IADREAENAPWQRRQRRTGPARIGRRLADGDSAWKIDIEEMNLVIAGRNAPQRIEQKRAIDQLARLAAQSQRTGEYPGAMALRPFGENRDGCIIPLLAHDCIERLAVA